MIRTKLYFPVLIFLVLIFFIGYQRTLVFEEPKQSRESFRFILETVQEFEETQPEFKNTEPPSTLQEVEDLLVSKRKPPDFQLESQTQPALTVQEVEDLPLPKRKPPDPHLKNRTQPAPTQKFEDLPLLKRNQNQYTVHNSTGNLPSIYLNDKLKKPTGFNKTCARFPTLFELKFKNDHWQVQKTSNGTLHLFNAYVDPRKNGSVRILATYDTYQVNTSFYCVFWYKTNKPLFVKSEVPFWIWRMGWGAHKGYLNHPYLITCPLKGVPVPVSVSVVEQPCDKISNNVRVFNNKGNKEKNFVVCVKGLSFPFEDKSARLAEWIELVNLLGAEKINFYEFNVHPKTKQLLDYYEKKGIIEVTPLSLVDDFSNQPLLQNLFLHRALIQRRLEEVIPYNDCLYKHLQEFKYVVLLDTDEVMVPKKGTWIQLLETLHKTLPNVTSYLFRNVYFLDNHLHQHPWFKGIPKYMHMLQHVDRARQYTNAGYFVKGFHNTSSVVALHNHFPFSCLNKCVNKEVGLDLAHLQHYRADCAQGATKNCQSMRENSVVDQRVWNFKDELIERVGRTFEDLGFSSDEK